MLPLGAKDIVRCLAWLDDEAGGIQHWRRVPLPAASKRVMAAAVKAGYGEQSTDADQPYVALEELAQAAVDRLPTPNRVAAGLLLGLEQPAAVSAKESRSKTRRRRLAAQHLSMSLRSFTRIPRHPGEELSWKDHLIHMVASEIVAEIDNHNPGRAETSGPRTARDIAATRTRITEATRRLIATHGLANGEWSAALSSQYFLFQLAGELDLLGSHDYHKLADRFLDSFAIHHDDSLDLSDDRILVTPEENLRIRECMLAEDEADPYFSASERTRADSVDPDLMHRNYLYGLCLGISARRDTAFLTAISDASLTWLFDARDPSPLDDYGGWHPYRVPWITARVLIGWPLIDRSSAEVDRHEPVVVKALESLVDRRTSTGLWRSGVGDWVSEWESTALCLEALVANSGLGDWRTTVEHCVMSALDDIDSWLPTQPSFGSDEDSNVTLAASLMCYALLLSRSRYGLEYEESVIATLLDFQARAVDSLAAEGNQHLRQFCTIPQVAAYAMRSVVATT